MADYSKPKAATKPVATKSVTLDEMFEQPLEQIDGLIIRAKELVSKSNPHGFVTQLEATLEPNDPVGNLEGRDE